jgi:hypothetical protein
MPESAVKPESIGPADITALQLITFGLVSGAVFFFAMICLIAFVIQPFDPLGPAPVETLPYFPLTVMVLILSFAAAFIADKVYQSRLSQITGPDNLLEKYRLALILKLGIVEAAAFAGLVLLFISVLDESIHINSFYWLNAFPLFVLFWKGASVFPSREKAEALLREYS